MILCLPETSLHPWLSTMLCPRFLSLVPHRKDGVLGGVSQNPGLNCRELGLERDCQRQTWEVIWVHVSWPKLWRELCEFLSDGTVVGHTVWQLKGRIESSSSWVHRPSGNPGQYSGVCEHE